MKAFYNFCRTRLPVSKVLQIQHLVEALVKQQQVVVEESESQFTFTFKAPHYLLRLLPAIVSLHPTRTIKQLIVQK